MLIDYIKIKFQHYHVPKYKSFLWKHHTKRLRSMQRIYDWSLTHRSIWSIPLQGNIHCILYSYITPVRFDRGFWNFLKFYLSKSLVPWAPKFVPNWVVSKQKSVSEKSKTSKKMFVTLSLVLTRNKSVKPLCSVNKFIHSDFSDFGLFAQFNGPKNSMLWKPVHVRHPKIHLDYEIDWQVVYQKPW